MNLKLSFVGLLAYLVSCFLFFFSANVLVVSVVSHNLCLTTEVCLFVCSKRQASLVLFPTQTQPKSFVARLTVSLFVISILRTC